MTVTFEVYYSQTDFERETLLCPKCEGSGEQVRTVGEFERTEVCAICGGDGEVEGPPVGGELVYTEKHAKAKGWRPQNLDWTPPGHGDFSHEEPLGSKTVTIDGQKVPSAGGCYRYVWTDS